ncbi:MAG: hypothetical protein ACLFPW_13235 [Spirochaetaceae bacterium]
MARFCRFFLLPLLLLVITSFSSAQEGEPPPEGQNEPPENLSLTEDTLAQDILTASFRDLIAWNATLDLSARGGRRELEDRLFEYYGIQRPPEEEEREGSEIIVEAARSARYFTIDAPEENYLVMRGGVVVQMREAEEEVSHRIEADQVVYNQERNTLSAMGDITYTVEREESTEVFTGESLQFRLDSWDGVFIDGESNRQQRDQPQQSQEEEFAVAGARLSRSPEEITVVEEGSITSSVADPPNYSIDATKIWVLAPGEWGIQNAVLKVGRVPVFYFPFFFLPGDKLFFHPAVGYEPRRGSYIQTTTYLIGAREQQEQPFSLLQLTENADESLREIEGLFLVLPENPVPPERPEWYLKIMADIYTNLGAYVGAEADLPELGPLQSFFVRAGIGASRTVFSQGDGFTPYYVNESGEASSNWESGWLIGRELPFRYEMELQTATSLPLFSLSLDMLLLSDPEFRRDFGVRSEQFDWSVILSGLDELEPEEQDRVESYTWRLNSSLSPSLSSLSPWVTSLSLERLNASLAWRSRQWPEERLPPALQQNPYTSSGEAAFFYPSEFVLPDASVRLQGELFSYPDTGRRARRGDQDVERGEDLRPPWKQPDEEGSDEQEGERWETPEARLPPIFEERPGILEVTPLSWRLRYQIVPSITINNVTDSDEWETPEAIDGSVAYSTMEHLSNYQLSHDGYFYDRLITFNGSLLFALKYQELLEEQGVSEDERENLEEQAFRGRSRRLTQSQSLAYTPLRRVERLEESRLRYDISTLLYERTFSELSEFGEPVYEEKTFEPRKEYYQTHETTAELRLEALRATQSLTLASALPPLDGRYDGSATAITGPLTTRVSTAYVEDPEEGWLFEPFESDQTLQIIEEELSISQRFVYEIEEDRLDRSVTTLNAWIASLGYEARHSPVYEFDPGGEGWTVVEGEEEFQPYSFTTTLNGDWEPAPFWKRRVYPEASINASYEANLLRFTESALRLSYGFSLSVYRFLDLQFEAVTVNDFTYQYFPSLARKAEREERNLFRDLGNSLALWDRGKREESFFKLESIRLSAVHDLQDWELTVSYEGQPTLESGGGEPPRYRWESLLTLFLRWRPISEIQSTITYDDGDLDFEN